MLKLYIVTIAALYQFVPATAENCYKYYKSGNLAQTAFLLDLHYSDSNNDYYKAYKEGIEKIVEKSTRADVYAGIATYSTFGQNTRDSCFQLKHGFSKLVANVATAFKNITPTKTSKSESPISAVVHAAADQEIGWLPGPETSKKQLIRRIVVFFADHEDKIEHHRNNQSKFNATGKETCHSILDYASVRRTLRGKGISVLALYSTKELKKKYDLTFYAFGIPYCSAVYGNSGKLARILEKSYDDCLYEIQKCSLDPIVKLERKERESNAIP